MLTQLLGWSSEALLGLLLVSAHKGRYLDKYPFFYMYVAGWLVTGLFRFYFFTFQLDKYLSFYWYTQFLLVAGGYCILWQLYAHTLDPYPGTAKMARVLVGTVFVMVLAQGLIMLGEGQAEELTSSVVRLERNLHSIQAILIMLFVMLVWYYSIPLGRNLRGLLMGYGLYIAMRLITLTLQSFIGPTFYAWWYYLEQMCILSTLLVWSLAFRSYQPNPAPDHAVALERDYEIASRWTAQALLRARGYLARIILQ